MSLFPRAVEGFDLMDLFYRLIIDVTTEFLLGQGINSLECPKGNFVDAFKEVQRFQMLVTAVRHFYLRSTYKRAIKVIDNFVLPFVRKALQFPEDELQQLSRSESSFTFLHSFALFTRDPKMIRDKIVAIFLAGRDTTASTLPWTFYELSNYPKLYAKLRVEVLYFGRTALADTVLPIGGGPNDDMPITVLKGDIIIYSTPALHRRKDLNPPASESFADPGIFSPGRWESWNPKHWMYLPFNVGPRICIGQNFVIAEISYVVSRVVQKYERIEYVGNWGAQEYRMEIRVFR
ncbi:hypothetical protein PABG_04068 [Paracoccidioides brasiliensis Pb03]|nr:hypothetical protein PABG_04068 [Paracoccidioides brasiliensis Pb03]